jgi:hypothetical protein
VVLGVGVPTQIPIPAMVPAGEVHFTIAIARGFSSTSCCNYNKVSTTSTMMAYIVAIYFSDYIITITVEIILKNSYGHMDFKKLP